MTALTQVRPFLRDVGRKLAVRDLAGAAAATTYFGGIAVVPWLLLASWTTTWFGPGASNGADRLAALRVLVPPDMGARPVYDVLVRAGTGAGWLSLLVLLLPASFYGEGIRRGCLSLTRRPDDTFTGWRGRAVLMPLLLGLPVLTWLGLRLGGVLVDLTDAGTGALLLRILLGFTGLWLGLALPLAWIYRLVAPGSLRWRWALLGGLATSSFVAGFLHGFQLFLAIPIDIGAPFAGLGVVGGVVAVGLWLYLLHTVVLVGWVVTLTLQEQVDGPRSTLGDGIAA